jgi:hypothetical protein
MIEEYDIWNEVLKLVGFEFKEECTFQGTCLLIYNKNESVARLYVNFKTGKVTGFTIDGWQMFETFQKENKNLLRQVKFNYLLS